MKKSFAITGLILLGLNSCKKEAIQQFDCTGATPTYTSDVAPILNASCALSGCHNAASQAEGINLSTYAGARSASNNDNFLGSIQHISGYKPMPENGAKLSDVNIKTISCWVQNGSPE